MTIVGIILLAVVVVPMQVTSFAESLSEHVKFGRPYLKRRTEHVVIVVGAITSEDLDALLAELYHSDSQSVEQFDVVLLCSCDEEHRKKLLYHVRSTKYWSSVHCLIGSPQSVTDMKRAAVKRARAVFVLANQSVSQNVRFTDADHERAADEEALMRGLSIKRFCPAVPLILSINQSINQSHVLTHLLSQFTAIQLVCLNELKMKLLAHAAVAPGVCGLLTNILTASQHKSLYAPGYFSHLRSIDRSVDSFDRFSPRALRTEPFTVEAWPFTYQSTTPSVNTNLSLHPARRWEDEYLFGLSFELFTCSFPSVVDGCTFAEAAALLYERLGVILIGVYGDHTSKQLINQCTHGLTQPNVKRVVLNPGYSMTISTERGDRGVVLACSIEQAEEIRWLDSTGKDIRSRWKRAQKLSAQFTQQPANQTIHLSNDTYNQTMNTGTFASQHSNQHQATVNQSVIGVPQAPVEFLSNGQSIEVLSNQPVRKPSESVSRLVDRPASELDIDPFVNHIVVCGFIDVHILSFIQRVRASDQRAIVLVINQSDDPIVPSINQAVNQSNIQDVFIVQGYRTDETHLSLDYTNPCFGHCHKSTSHSAKLSAIQSIAYDPATGQSVDVESMLERSNWFRRACVHRADTVIVLAHTYSSSQSEYQLDSRLKADRAGLILTASIQSYLAGCKVSDCPSLLSINQSINQSTAAQLMTIELVNSVNLRLFRHDHSQSSMYHPNKPRPTGWSFIWRIINDWLSDEPNNQSTNQPKLSFNHPSFVSSSGLSFSNQLFDSLAVRAFYQPVVHDALCSLIEGQTINPAVSDNLKLKLKLADDKQFHVELLLLDTPSQLVGQSFGYVQLKLMLESGWVALGLYRDRREVNNKRRKRERHSSHPVSSPPLTEIPVSKYQRVNSPTPAGAAYDIEMAQLSSVEIGAEQTLRMTRATTVKRATNNSKAPRKQSTVEQYAESDDDSDNEKEDQQAPKPQSTKVPWTVRSHFYVLTNPPADTILHEKDRLYVIVQRELNGSTFSATTPIISPVASKDMNEQFPSSSISLQSDAQTTSDQNAASLDLADQSEQINQLRDQLTAQQSILLSITQQLTALNQAVVNSNKESHSASAKGINEPPSIHSAGSVCSWQHSDASYNQTSTQPSSQPRPRAMKSRRGSNIDTLDPIVGEQSHLSERSKEGSVTRGS